MNMHLCIILKVGFGINHVICCACQVIAMVASKQIKNRKLYAADLHQWVLHAAFDRNGCRRIQDVLAEVNQETNSSICNIFEKYNCFKDLYESPHGNHVLQRLIEYSRPDIAGRILVALENGFEDLCLHEYVVYSRVLGSLSIYDA